LIRILSYDRITLERSVTLMFEQMRTYDSEKFVIIRKEKVLKKQEFRPRPYLS